MKWREVNWNTWGMIIAIVVCALAVTFWPGGCS